MRRCGCWFAVSRWAASNVVPAVGRTNKTTSRRLNGAPICRRDDRRAGRLRLRRAREAGGVAPVHRGAAARHRAHQHRSGRLRRRRARRAQARRRPGRPDASFDRAESHWAARYLPRGRRRRGVFCTSFTWAIPIRLPRAGLRRPAPTQRRTRSSLRRVAGPSVRFAPLTARGPETGQTTGAADARCALVVTSTARTECRR